VDYLSDSDIAKIKTQLQSNNLTIDQAEPMALSLKMSASEFAKRSDLLCKLQRLMM
jgi:hypothetical protein